MFFKRPKPGDVRIKRTFLVFPVWVAGERRWWKKVAIIQVYSASGSQTGYDYTPAGWMDMQWADKVESIGIPEPKLNIFTASYSSEIKFKLKREFEKEAAA